MRILHLVAGAGGMYCGSCLQGNTLAVALREAGRDVLLVPLYTPLRTDEESASVDRVAFGGVNVYLQQRSALFRRAPRLLDRWLDSPRLLRWAARRGWRVRAERLGALTVSMLRGEEGRQRKELDKLIRWLDAEIRPDIVHLNNALLVGMARQLNRRLGVPVVCTLSGEDVFLEKLPEPHYSEARAELRRRVGDLAAMVAMNRYFADFMAEYLSVPREQIRVIAPGLNLVGHGTDPPPSRARDDRGTVTIGFLARICPDKGLHQLAEALELLAEDPELPPFQLRAAGYLDPSERAYLDRIRRRLAERGLSRRFEYLGDLDRPAKIAFLRSLDVISLPTVYRESKGLSLLEAWANGVPAVVPDHGTFPELVADTGGGLLHAPGDATALAAALKRIILDPQLAANCGRQAQQAVHQRYNAPTMAQRMLELYTEICSPNP